MYVKRGVLVLFVFLVMSILVLGVAFAQEDVGGGGDDIDSELDEDGNVNDIDEGNVDDDLDDFGDEFEDEGFDEDELDEEDSILEDIGEEIGDSEIELESGGITPDSSLYFIDEFFDNFGDEGDVSEEKAAEIKAMLEEGKIEEAREAYDRYIRYAEKFAEEVGPDERDETRRRSVAIKKALESFEDEYGFIVGVLEQEEKVVTAVEIASRIGFLCEQLVGLDFLEYERVCKLEGDEYEEAPDWRRRLDDRLTDEQREQARKFGEIMESCFRTAGGNCPCGDIPHSEMAATCIIAAPLASACDGGDENACNQLDEIDIPELPDYLLDVFDDLEDGIADASYDNHIPGFCRDVGITGRERDARERCFAIMIEEEAPPECREALTRARVTSERQARELCENIMFEIHAPEECVERGIRDPDECAEIFEDEFDRERGDGESRHGFDFRGCINIDDPQKRLRCFDEGFQSDFHEDDGKSFEEILEETHELERACAQRCAEQGRPWDFSNGCICGDAPDRDYSKYYNDYYEGDHDDFDYDDGDDYESDFDHDDFEGDFSPSEDFDEDDYESDFSVYEEDDGEDYSEEDSGLEGDGDLGSGDSGGDSGDSGIFGSGEGESDGGSDGGEGGGGITGQVVGGFITGNAFLDYYFEY